MLREKSGVEEVHPAQQAFSLFCTLLSENCMVEEGKSKTTKMSLNRRSCKTWHWSTEPNNLHAEDASAGGDV